MHPFLFGAWLACQALDVTTTAVALRNPRLHEGNPLARGGRGYALKVAVNLAGVALYRRQTAPVLKVAIPVIFASAGCGAGALNIRTMRSVR